MFSFLQKPKRTLFSLLTSAIQLTLGAFELVASLVFDQQPGISLNLWFGSGLSGHYVTHHYLQSLALGGFGYIRVELCRVVLMLFLAKQHSTPE